MSTSVRPGVDFHTHEVRMPGPDSCGFQWAT